MHLVAPGPRPEAHNGATMPLANPIRKLLLAAAVALFPASASAGVLITVNVAPPALPVYEQPLCPGNGFLWTPGFWAWGDEGYYWVPGVWVRPPAVGLLWTPGYWGWNGGAFLFHTGYWGPHVGFYGGVPYGFGYTGIGYAGGYWNHDAFAYNRAVNNVSITEIHNTYDQNVTVRNTGIERVSYNGGNGGINARPTAEEQSALLEQHLDPTISQQLHVHNAASDRGQLATVNSGHPRNLAESRIGEPTANQQAPIPQGVRTGRANHIQSSNLDKADSRQQARADRLDNNGRLTPQARQNLNQPQINLSRSIRQDRQKTRQNLRPRQPAPRENRPSDNRPQH